MGFNPDIKSVMTECQSGNHNTMALISRMSKLYQEMGKNEFESSFIFCLKKFLIVLKRVPQVERGLDFISKFVSSLKVSPKVKARKPSPKKRRKLSRENEEKDDDSDDDEEEEMHPFQLKIFRFLIKHHEASSKAVRFRCCQLINMLLSDLGDGAQIDGTLFESIHRMMLIRVRDFSPLVRIQAVLGMRRLQEPENPKCSVIEVYVYLLERDQNQDVRRAVLGSIAVTHGTLKHILKRTRDVNDLVRRLAYKVVAEKVHIKAMPIASRVTLIKRGVNDRSEIVREACLNVLVKAWLGALDNDLLKLLDCLDCQNYLPECQKLVLALLHKSDPGTLVSEFNVLDKSNCIPPERLTKENALLWRCLCQHLQTLGAEQEEHLEKLIPTCIQFVEYLKCIIRQTKNRREKEDVFEAAQNSFILQQVLIIMGFLDVSDEAGRRAVLGVIRELLLDEHTSEDIVKHLVEQYLRLIKDDETCLTKITEVISDILQPIIIEENVVVEAEKRRKLEIRFAELNVELMYLRDVLEDSITKQDFNKAAEVKSSMEDLEKQKNHVERELSGRQENPDEQNGLGLSQITASQSRSQPKDDPITLMRCLMIIQQVLKGIRFNKLSPSILSFINMLIIPGITSHASGVRNLAIKCLGLCCLRDPKKIGQYLMIFMQATLMDTEEIKITGFKCLFNFLHFFGFPTVKKALTNLSEEPEGKRNNDVNDEDDNEEGGNDGSGEDDFGTNILNHMTKNLDNESPAIRTTCAEGLSKLLISSRLSSPTLLTRLLLLWYNPMTEEDTRMRHCLGAFFPYFAYSSRANQEMIGEAFLPTLKTLLDAPSSSPLSQVKVMKVAELMVHLSNFRHQMAKVKEGIKSQDELPLMDKCPHDDIAVALCNEILTDPNNVENVRIFAKSLLLLELTPGNDCLLKSLKVLSKKMVTEVKDKNNRNYLYKFLESVYEMVKDSKAVDKEASQLDETVVIEEAAKDDKEEHISVVASTESSLSIMGEPTTSNELNKSEMTAMEKGLCRALQNKKSSQVLDVESANSSDDFERSPPQQIMTRKSLARKAKDATIRKQVIVKKRKRNLLLDDDDDDDDDDNDDDEDDCANIQKQKEIKKRKMATNELDNDLEFENVDDDDDKDDVSDEDDEVGLFTDEDFY